MAEPTIWYSGEVNGRCNNQTEHKTHTRIVFGFLIDICKETSMHEKIREKNTHRYTHASDVNFARDRVNWDRMYLDTHVCSSFIKRRMGCDGDDPTKSTLAHFFSSP